MKKMIRQLFDFIEKSPTSGHTVNTVSEMLLKEGFERLKEADSWKLKAGGRYFTTRGMTSILAFTLPKKDFAGFSIIAPHGDSPCFKVKGSPEMRVDNKYTKLNTEVYGGMPLISWVDRPLSVAGRLVVRTEEGIKTILTDIDRDLLLIPGLAIHMNRDINSGIKLDPQKDTLPLLGGGEADLLSLAAENAGVKKEDIISYDLYLYPRAGGTVFGAGEEFIAAPRLDDLECAFSAVRAFIDSDNKTNCRICAIFDNEEVGSLTRQGADSTFLADCITRICEAVGKSEEEKIRAIANGFMLSADNAHGVHPDYPEKADPTSKCYLNGGVVVKHSTRYATDATTAGVFARICEKAGVPIQDYYNNSSVTGGSTLGNLSGSHVSIPTVDIGLAQLSMHSPYETAGKEDLCHMIKAMKSFYESEITCEEDGSYKIH